MPNTVRGFFHTLAHAEQTKFEIATLKQIPTDMQVYDQTGVQLTAGTAASPNSSFESPKDSLGFGPLSLPLYPEGVRRGGPVLDIQADDRHERQDRVPQRMLEKDAARAEALGTRGANIVLPQHLKNTAPDVT